MNNDKNRFKMVSTPNQRSAGNNPNAPKKPRIIRGCTTGGKVLLPIFNEESDSNCQNSRN